MADANVPSKQFKSPAIHRTPHYRARSAYWGMLARCGNPNGKNPTYANVELRMTLEEWMTWAVPRYEEFNLLHSDVSPAVSRYGDMGHYEIGNMEIISQAENASRQKRDTTYLLRPDGNKLCSKCLAVHSKEKFSKASRNRDGLATWCRQCIATSCQEWRDRKRNGPQALR